MHVIVSRSASRLKAIANHGAAALPTLLERVVLVIGREHTWASHLVVGQYSENLCWSGVNNALASHKNMAHSAPLSPSRRFLMSCFAIVDGCLSFIIVRAVKTAR